MNTKTREAICSKVVSLLSEERKRQHLSMHGLAEKSGLSQSAISLVERELRSPTLDTLLRIAGVLGIDLDDVLHQARCGLKEMRQLL